MADPAPGDSTATRTTDSMENTSMNRDALRLTVTDRMFHVLLGIYVIVTGALFVKGVTPAAVVSAGVYAVIIAAVTYGMWRVNRSSARHAAEQRAQRHEHDLRIERMEQENTRIAAGGPEAEAILERRAAERHERNARERDERQARIAAYEARNLTSA